MARIYRTTDRIQVKIDDITVTISPLTYEQKAEINSLMAGYVNGDIKAVTKGMATAVKYAVKSVDGLEDADGEPYQVEAEESGLSDDCVNDLLNLEMTEKLTNVCLTLLHGAPTEFVDNDGKPLKGVEIVNKGKSTKKR